MDEINLQALLDSATANQDLLSWCNGFITKSRQWRRQNWEDRLRRFQRNADSIYDPDIKDRKKKWQSTAFIPMTASHREIIHAALYKTMVGARPLLEVKARPAVPAELDQSENIKDLITRELERSRFEVGFNTVLEEATTYGSSFVRIRWSRVEEERRVREPIFGPVDPVQAQVMAMQGMLPPRPPVVDEQMSMKKVLVYNGVKFEPISIWDVFPDPKALAVEGNPLAIRYRLNYGDVISGIKDGWINPEAAERLKGLSDGEDDEDDVLQVKSDRAQVDGSIDRPDYGKKLRCFEVYARLPKKWVLDEMGPEDDPDALIPARVIFHKDVILFKEASEEYDGEPPVIKLDYIPVSGQFYGRGIPEALQDLQDVTNEGVNQRIDANARLINPKFAVVEKGLVDPRDIEDPYAAIRLNDTYVKDVRQAFAQVDFKPLDRAAYIDPQEMERYAQERTGANRVTIGTAGQVKDANQTLGGMELLKQAAGERFAFIGMLMEFSFMQSVFRAYWKQIYSHIDLEDIARVLGPERMMTFQLLSPEQIEQDLIFHPQGVFTQENKAMLQARISAIRQGYGMMPWFDHMAAFNKESQAADIAPDELKLSPDEMQDRLVAEGLMAMPPQPGAGGGGAGGGLVGPNGQPIRASGQA